MNSSAPGKCTAGDATLVGKVPSVIIGFDMSSGHTQVLGLRRDTSGTECELKTYCTYEVVTILRLLYC
jgi:hypothetical protein